MILITPIGNMCPQTYVEVFYLFIKPFYFLSTFFFFPQMVPGVGPLLGPSGKDSAGVAIPAWVLSEKLLRNKACSWFPSQAPPHHSSFSHVCSHLESDWLRTLGSPGNRPFLSSSLAPRLCSWCSLWPESNQLNFLLAEPHPLLGAFPGDMTDWGCPAFGLIFLHCAQHCSLFPPHCLPCCSLNRLGKPISGP